MKITLRPYAKDPSRWQLDIRLMNPCKPEQELRRRFVAPSGMDQKQARQWGERQVPSMLRALVVDQEPVPVEIAPARKETPRLQRPPASAMTLTDFYTQRFEPEHVHLQKPSTRDSYASLWRSQIKPLLGDIPLAALDDDRISVFRAALHQRLAASTANIVLSKVARMLRFARKVRLIEVVPTIERLPVPRKRPKPVYSEDAIARLTAAARRRGPDALVICLLALDLGLRVSEICALEWGDIDLREGTLIVQHNIYRGERLTPKGNIGKLALTSALREALLALRGDMTLGPMVVYRTSVHTRQDWAPHTPDSIRHLLKQLQLEAGLKRSGPHLLRSPTRTSAGEITGIPAATPTSWRSCSVGSASSAKASLLASLEALGEVAALGIRSLKMCKLGQDIGSARMVGLGQVYGAWTALVGGEVPLCRSLLAEVVQMQGEEMESLHIYALKVEVECALFVGDPAAAWRRVEDVWAALERSRLLDAGLRRFVALSVRARAGLALWASNEACPQHVMDVVTQDIARLGREDSEHAMPTIHLLRAGVANRRGEGNVEELLRAAISGFDALGMALHATCVRWILARRSGSAEAAAELPVRSGARTRRGGTSRWQAPPPLKASWRDLRDRARDRDDDHRTVDSVLDGLAGRLRQFLPAA